MAGLDPIDPRSVVIAPEPLAESAPLARALAARHCRYVDHSGVGCRDYHGTWQYLRLLDLVTTPRDHAAFYVAPLLDAIGQGRGRVLISGAVDYSMLTVVLSAFAAAGAAGDITVTDICETPLQLCRWYAGRQGVAITTRCSDILEHRPDAPYDLIITHSFLGGFDSTERARLVSLWRDWLRPGGEVVTVNRIRPGAPRVVTFATAEVDKFRAAVRQAASRHAGTLDVDIAALDALAEGYLAQRAVYPVTSREELAALFETGGFHIRSLTLEKLDATGLPSGPTLRGGAEYAKILASRA